MEFQNPLHFIWQFLQIYSALVILDLSKIHGGKKKYRQIWISRENQFQGWLEWKIRGRPQIT
jgi:hypothetical protein